MVKRLKEKKSKEISNEQILSLYHQGYSANIIANDYNLNRAYVGKVLRESGLKPRDYRSCPDFIKDVLRELILAGFTYSEISKRTNVAYNYIREYVSNSEEIKERARELARRKANNAVPPTVPPATVCPDELVEQFCAEYMKGVSGFCVLMSKFEATADQVVYLFSIINDEMVNMHNFHLNQYILSEFASGIPVIGISKKLGVSPAHIVNVVQEQKKKEI